MPTITESTALWKALRHREEVNKRETEAQEAQKELATGSWLVRLRHALGGLHFFRGRH